MRKFFILFLLLSTVVYSQNDYSKVMDLLLANKRDDARKLFDKQFSESKISNIDLLFLDAFLDEEQGKLYYDESLLKNIENLPNSQYYIAPFINKGFISGNINSEGFDDTMLKKIDFLGNSEKFKNLPVTIYRKAISERKKLNYDEAIKYFDALHVITQWQFCGVFENLNGSGLDTEYEPETHPESDLLFNANSNGQVGWYVPKKYQKEAYHFFSNEAEYGSGIIYAQTFITVPDDKQYLLSFGTSIGIKVFINDVEVYVNNETGKTNLDAFNLKLNLKKGTNRILFKIAIASNGDYMSGSLKNIDKTIPTEVTYYNQYKPYNSSTFEEINPEEVDLDYELYFENLVKNNPNNVLYRLFLYQAYEANNKKEKAHDALDELDKKYPKSSFISRYFVNSYRLDDNNQKVDEIIKNIENNDKDYFLITLQKAKDTDWLRNAQIKELEEYRDKSKQYKSNFYGTMFDFILASRNSDIDKMLELINNLTLESNNNETFKKLSATLYYKLKDDKTKYIEILEGIVETRENFEVNNLLVDFYKDSNRKDDVKYIIQEQLKNYFYLNTFRDRSIEILLNEDRYDEALALVNENLEYFPYSFLNMEQKATVYNYKKNTKEAEKYIRESLSHNSANSTLRKRLYDITKTPDEIEEVAVKDVYKIIKERRNTSLKGDYGVTTLLDEYIVNILPEGGRKSKVTYLYEITSEKGIEEMKEYSISTYSNNILKSEIVKIDGSIVPAEEGSGTLVFTDLKVGDVIFVQYEVYENSSGRFYKDFDLSCYFNSVYPEVEVIFGFICPPNTQYTYDFTNGTVPFTTKKINNKTCTIWKRTNVPAMYLHEAYSPNFNDLTNTIRIGTIKSWKEISNWYSDLVKKNLKLDKITKKAFVEIFPNGVTGLSQEEVAKKIYNYIETNITYSSLDFRQSGYVPQKPSKTILTKLGDCKDVSTLFVALSELAGLKANLVLVTTNDNGFKSMILPSNDFNHCIVKVILEGKDYFIELTDKFLPFKALPSSLYYADALVISFDKVENENSKLIKIPFDNALQNSISTKTVVEITENNKSYLNTITVQGANKAYYNELYSNATTEDMRKKQIEEDYNTKLKKIVSLQSSKVIKNEMFDKDITIETKFTVSEHLQTVGSLKITDLPFIDKVYTRDIIALESRKYDIEYFDYENCNEYHSEITLNVPQDTKITEVPESKYFTYKEHRYAITFELVKPNSLKVSRNVTLNWDTIPASEYLEYKKYIENVIQAEEQIIGFK